MKPSAVICMNPVVAYVLLLASVSRPLVAGPPSSVRKLDIAPVWSGHPVGFALLTRGRHQLVAFYDADRRMTIGTRRLDQSHWQLVRLPSVLGWDSHNYVTMAVDRAGQIHVSGNMHGRPLVLPITPATAEVVDPVPPAGGMINGNTKIGFDAQQRPVISYHKFDAQGKTQLYSARREAGGWRIYQVSNWDYRWEFQGGGTIRFEIGFGPVVAGPDGSLTQTWHHPKHGSGNWKLDPETLRPVGKAPPPRSGLPGGFSRAESTWPGMEVRTAADLGAGDDPKVRYVLRWETLPSNRDRPRPGPFPPPTMLRLYQVPRQ
jgi:hypothetical protein